MDAHQVRARMVVLDLSIRTLQDLVCGQVVGRTTIIRISRTPILPSVVASKHLDHANDYVRRF